MAEAIDPAVKLISVESTDSCIVCYEQTLNRVSCCSATICNDCYFKWLKRKRQCLHCKEDQCDFDHWIEKYRTEPDDDDAPLPLPIPDLIQFDMDNVFGIMLNTLHDIQAQNPNLFVTVDTVWPQVTSLAPPEDGSNPFQYINYQGILLSPIEDGSNPFQYINQGSLPPPDCVIQ